MKRKIGTVVDDELYRDVKLLAAQERRRISDVVQRALSDYVKRSKRVRHGKQGRSKKGAGTASSPLPSGPREQEAGTKPSPPLASRLLEPALHGKTGLARLLERDPLKVTDEQFREVMEADFFDQ